jgi:hypothetical protein
VHSSFAPQHPKLICIYWRSVGYENTMNELATGPHGDVCRTARIQLDGGRVLARMQGL